MIQTAALVVVSYLFGSFSSAIVVSRLMGLPDPRGEGSGNPGATNVLRYGGKQAGALTLLGDILKGTLPLVLARLLGAGPGGLALVGLAAFLGHLFPVFFGFKGGKGVATALGVLLGWHWLMLIVAGAIWLAMALITRISSLSALTAFALAPVYVYWLSASAALTGATVVMSAIIFWRHRTNIRRIMDGTEGRIGGPAS